MRKNALLIINLTLVLISIVLMTLPTSAILVFSAGPGKIITKTFSYFDMIVLGYGNWFPFLTVVFSIILLIILLWEMSDKKYSKKREGCLKICFVISVITSFLSLLLFNGTSIPGISIFILLLLSTVLEYRLSTIPEK